MVVYVEAVIGTFTMHTIPDALISHNVARGTCTLIFFHA